MTGWRTLAALALGIALVGPLRAAEGLNPLRTPDVVLRPVDPRGSEQRPSEQPPSLVARSSLFRPAGFDSELPQWPASAAATPTPAEAAYPAVGDYLQGAEPDCEALPPTPCELMLLHWLARPWSPHTDPNDPQRHLGLGQPLAGTSWRNRPLYVDLFAGGLIGADLQSGEVFQGGGFLAGGRFGGDFDHYWGLETRLAFSDMSVRYAGSAANGQSNAAFFDASVLYYPLGDSRWRPYFSLGFGLANYRYETLAGTKLRPTAVEVPWGIGLKYMLTPSLALRFDAIDNFSLASGNTADAMHNFSFTGGLEFRFGGRPVVYGSW
jgi:hypothetical protein